MKRIISVLMSIVIIATMLNTQLMKVFAVNPRSIQDGIYIIESLVGQRKLLDIAEGSNEQGTKMIIWEPCYGAHQAFRFSYDESDGCYTIQAMHSNKYIGVEKSTDGENTQVKQYDLPIEDNLKWEIIPNSAGYYEFKIKSTGFMLDVCNAQNDNGINLQLYQRNNTKAQMFYLHHAVQTTENKYIATSLSNVIGLTPGQIRDIDMRQEGESIRFTANIAGDKRWFKYKFVWRESEGWGVQGSNWDVIREYDFSDTVVWKPPRMDKDYIIYMDVVDAYGTCEKGFNKLLSRETLQARKYMELAETNQRNLERNLYLKQEKSKELEQTRKKLETEVSNAKQILDKAEKRKAEITSKLEVSKKVAEEVEQKRKKLEANIIKARQKAIEREKQRQELQDKIEQIKQSEKTQQELQAKIKEAKELAEQKKQQTKTLEQKKQLREKQIKQWIPSWNKQTNGIENEDQIIPYDLTVEETITENTEDNIYETESLEDQPGLSAEDLYKINLEFSKYIPYIKEIVENETAEKIYFGDEILKSSDTSLDTISKKLMYVCHRMSQDASVKKNVTPYPVQILAVMKLVESVLNPEFGIRGSVGDIKTGEGKSLVVTLAAIILQSYGRKIDIVTPNMELATRDWKDNKQYYNLFGIKSGFLYDKIRDSEFKDAENESEESNANYDEEYNFEILDRDIMYTTGATMQWMYLKSVFSAENLRNREYDVCIVDEADNLLIDGASSPALISSNFPTKHAKEILEKVYQSVVFDKKDESQIKVILQEDFKDSNVNEEELELMIEAAKKSENLIKGKDYILENDKFWGNQVQIIDSNTGFKLNSSRWHAYVHDMIEIKEGLNLHFTSVTKCAVSPMIFFASYKNLLGVTGTTGSEKEEELFKNIYKLSTFKVPTHRGVKRDVMVKTYDPQKENLNDLITKETLEESQKGRSVLVILDSINATNEIKEKYLKNANLIQGINVQSDRLSIRNAGKSGVITVSTIAAGRGTDIKLDKDSIKAGGLHVIVSKLPAQGRTLVQNVGRSSRQGQPGSATVYMIPENRFVDIPKINPSTVNLFRLQKRFSNYIREHWPWMISKKDIYTSESEYRFGANFEEILRTDAEIIVDKFFWPKKVLSNNEYQECLDLTKNMVLNAWGSMYTHLATSEKGQNMEYCNQKYDELLKAIHLWISDDCPGPEEYIGRWAREIRKDDEIFEFLYTPRKNMTIRAFLEELFKYKRLQIHAMNAGYNINFDSMLKFMPEEHQEAYKAFLNAKAVFNELMAKYNRDVAEYNKREEEIKRIAARENNQMYAITESKAVEIPSKPEVHRPVEGPQRAQISEVPQAEQKGIFQSIGTAAGTLLEKFVDAISIQADAAGVSSSSTAGAAPSPIFKNPEPRREYISALPSHAPDCPMNPDNIRKIIYACPRCSRDRGLDYKNNAPGTYPYRLEHRYVANCQHNHEEIICNCGGHHGHEAPGELSPEASLKRIIESTKSHSEIQRELPLNLPFPIKPKEPNWNQIGWEPLKGHNKDEVIWMRWLPPNAEKYRHVLFQRGNFIDLGTVSDEELDRLDREIRKEIKKINPLTANFGINSIIEKRIKKEGIVDYTSEIQNKLEQEHSNFFNFRAKIKKASLKEKPYFILEALEYFFEQVTHNGPWDIKRDSSWKNKFPMPVPSPNENFKFHSYILTKEDLGNLTYGYLGTALGLNPKTLYIGGGAANKGKNIIEMIAAVIFDSDVYIPPNYGDDGNDHINVKRGIELYNKLNYIYNLLDPPWDNGELLSIAKTLHYTLSSLIVSKFLHYI